MNLEILKRELIDDPMGFGYAGKTDMVCADMLNAPSRRPIDRDFIEAREILEATDPAEWKSLDPIERDRFAMILSACPIDLRGPNTTAALAAMFLPNSKTRAALRTLNTRMGSRAEELFQPGAIVHYWDVGRARSV